MTITVSCSTPDAEIRYILKTSDRPQMWPPGENYTPPSLSEEELLSLDNGTLYTTPLEISESMWTVMEHRYFRAFKSGCEKSDIKVITYPTKAPTNYVISDYIL